VSSTCADKKPTPRSLLFFSSVLLANDCALVAHNQDSAQQLFDCCLNSFRARVVLTQRYTKLIKLTQQSLNINDVSLAPVTKVRDLGVIFDDELTMTAHVNHVVSGSFYQLRQQLRSVQRCLPFDARRALVTAFISSRLDYCKATCTVWLQVTYSGYKL